MTKNILILALAAALTGFGALGCDDGGEEATEAPAEAESTSEGADEAPMNHRVEVTVNASGYEPSEVQAMAGHPLTMVFTRTTDEGCGNELVIADADIERELPLNEPVEVTFTPSEAGELRFSCGMDMYDGKIVVR